MPTQVTTPRGISLYYSHHLGQGTFGVASAYKNRKGDMFCLKTMSVRSMEDDDRAQALREVQVMKDSCHHPNVVRYYDSWFTNSHMYLLMELASNGSLDKIIERYCLERKTFPETKVAHMVQELADALRFCHEELHVLHRDIKPANVLVDQIGTVKLADFGLAKSVDLCTTYCGSPLYISPELCRNNSYSYPADMWALGCVAYEVMALHSPWIKGNEPLTQPALIHRILHSRPTFSNLRYTDKLVNMTRWMLQYDVRKRATAGDIVSLLEMRSPPKLDATLARRTDDIVDIVDIADDPEPLVRQKQLVADARDFLAGAHHHAAQAIQYNFRATRERKKKMPVAMGIAVEAADAVPPLPVAPPAAAPPTTQAPDAPPDTATLDRAMRYTLNRRCGRLPRIPSKPSARLEQLATPRAPKHAPTPRLPVVRQRPRPAIVPPHAGGVRTPRPAWL